MDSVRAHYSAAQEHLREAKETLKEWECGHYQANGDIDCITLGHATGQIHPRLLTVTGRMCARCVTLFAVMRSLQTLDNAEEASREAISP